MGKQSLPIRVMQRKAKNNPQTGNLMGSKKH